MSDTLHTVSEQQQTEQFSVRVVQEVADVTGTDPLELPPLYEAIDSEALEEICRSDAPSLRVQFSYAGCEVTVRDTDDIDVEGQNDTQSLDGDSAVSLSECR